MAYADNLDQGVVVLPTASLSQNKRTLLSNLIQGVVLNEQNAGTLATNAKVKLNDLDSRINDIVSDDTITDGEIQATLQAIVDLQSDSSSGGSFVSALGNIYNVLNSTEISDSYDVTVSATDGYFSVDLTSRNFTSTSDYSIQCTVQGTEPVSVSYEKVDAVTAKVFLRDSEDWEFDEDGLKGRDCASTNVTVTLTIISNPVPLSATFNEADGDVTTIGDAGTTTPPPPPQGY